MTVKFENGFGTSNWLGEFSSRETEDDFHKSVFDADKKYTRTVIKVLTIIFFLFSIGDYGVFERTDDFLTSLYIKLVFLATAIFAWWKVGACESFRQFKTIVFLFNFCLAGVLALIEINYAHNSSLPPNLFELSSVYALLSAGIYFIYRTSMRLRAVNGLMYLASYLIVAWASPSADINILVFGLFFVFAASFMGFIASANNERLRRQAWASNAQLKDANTTLVEEIEERKVLEEELRVLATTDPLTGVNNRRYFLEYCDKELERARREGSFFSILVIDLDHFKKINDNFGHDGGDAALCVAANVFRDSLRPYDALGRIGGEEFAILLPGANKEDARVLADRICKKLYATELAHKGQPVQLSASIGVAQNQKDEAIAGILSQADAAMYEAKQSGRNQVAVA